jgi:hypothetical protein
MSPCKLQGRDIYQETGAAVLDMEVGGWRHSVRDFPSHTLETSGVSLLKDTHKGLQVSGLGSLAGGFPQSSNRPGEAKQGIPPQRLAELGQVVSA